MCQLEALQGGSKWLPVRDGQSYRRPIGYPTEGRQLIRVCLRKFADLHNEKPTSIVFRTTGVVADVMPTHGPRLTPSSKRCRPARDSLLGRTCKLAPSRC